MIKKILTIKNVGRYIDFATAKNKEYWNGELLRINIIYANNGLGKTTLAILFKSLKKGYASILKNKQSFGVVANQEVQFMTDENKSLRFKDNKWSMDNIDIDVFDIHFIEDNIYTGSSMPLTTRSNLFEIIVGEEGIKLKKEIEKLKIRKEELAEHRLWLKKQLKSDEITNETEKEYLNIEYNGHNHIQKEYADRIREADIKLGKYSQEVFGKYIPEINNNLRKFSPHLELKKLSKTDDNKEQLVSYYISVNGQMVSFETNTNSPSFKYSLSEGDKSAVALSFFLALITMDNDLSKKILVFDDPLSSFDYSRKLTTIKQLEVISQKVKQLIVLTHDIHFAKDLTSQFGLNKCKNLKIIGQANTSIITEHDIENETLSGLFKDISVLKRYLENGAKTETEKREVIRCIRPVLEGLFRIKFFQELKPNEWLGDVLDKIRIAQEGTLFFRLKNIYEDLDMINDYSKSFHHSNAERHESNINDIELSSFIKLTLKLIEKI